MKIEPGMVIVWVMLLNVTAPPGTTGDGDATAFIVTSI
jgi:hypothetical protein